MFREIKDLTDIGLNVQSIKPHESTGFMSKIYTANSSVGKVVIHIINPVEEQRRQQIHLKTKRVLDLLEKEEVPTAKMYGVGEIKKKYFMVQEFLPGNLLGKRSLEGKDIVDTYHYQGFEDQIKDLIQKINKVEVGGYGWLFGGKAKYDTWEDFLLLESKDWLESLSHLEMPSLSDLKKIIEDNKSLMKAKPNLLHGDILNPSNILIKDDKITGILDVEWALAGDPQWEWGFTPLNGSDDFAKATRLYSIFWCLWGSSMHRDDELFHDLYKRFQKGLSEFL